MSEHRHKFFVDGKLVYFLHSHHLGGYGNSHRHDIDAQKAYPAQMPRPGKKLRLRVAK